METEEIKVPDFAYLSKQVNNIGISWQTRNLIKCYAMLEDIYGYVFDTVFYIHPESDDMEGGLLDGFKKAYTNTESELMKLIATVMDDTMKSKDFSQI